jgi:C-terminal processing protease CtpA/Prc
MLAELQDLHVWIETPDGKTLHPHRSGHRANYNFDAVAAKLNPLQRFPPIGFVGRTTDGFGVIVIDGLPPGEDAAYAKMLDATQALFDAPGFIVDLRSNGGGAEPRAAEIAGLFASGRRIYARNQVRSGPQRDDFRETPPRYIEPAIARPFTRPVICLVGPGCVSSGEGFALMMKAMDHVTLMGQPTRGASGNPHPVTLSNGVSVWFSRWISLEPDGRPIEDRGVQPDVTVEHAGAGDPTFEKAIQLLRDST